MATHAPAPPWAYKFVKILIPVIKGDFLPSLYIPRCNNKNAIVPVYLGLSVWLAGMVDIPSNVTAGGTVYRPLVIKFKKVFGRPGIGHSRGYSLAGIFHNIGTLPDHGICKEPKTRARSSYAITMCSFHA